MTRRLASGARTDLSGPFIAGATTLVCLALFARLPSAAAADPKPEPGLAVTFATDSGKFSDRAIAPNVWLHVESGKPPTPFVPGGRFTATWEGAIHAELRGSFHFQADLNGALQLEINGRIALEAANTGGASLLSKPVQLNKGPNVF